MGQPARRAPRRLQHVKRVFRYAGSPSVESAFGSGAAALVSYRALKALVPANAPAAKIARTFEVSEALVSFRLKITGLYRVGRHLQPTYPRLDIWPAAVTR